MSSPLYTATGVHLPLTHKFPNIQAETVGFSRFSKSGDREGDAGQRNAWFNQHGDNPDVALMRQIPEAAWDPRQPAIGAMHGVTWIRMSDLHHTLVKQTPVAAVVARGTSVFVSATVSATVSHITRDDGSTANAGTWLILSLLNFYPSTRRIQWAEDLTRASRNGVNWELVKEACHSGHTLMTFGNRTYNLSDKGDRTALNILTAVSSADDFERRAHLSGKRVEKMARGGAAVPEEGMPRGWVHQRDEHGRKQKVGEKGRAPKAEGSMAPVLDALYTRFDDGASFQELAPLLAEFERQGLLTRRDPKNPANNYQNLTTAGRAHDAVKPFFCVRGTEPSQPPDEAAITAYETGASPSEVFDLETRLFISRIELVRTGVFVRRLTNDLPGIKECGIDGHRPVMKDEHDQMGAFYVESERWPWPTDQDGEELVSFGIDDEVLRRCAGRLLRQLSRTREHQGGRPRRDGQRRLLQTFASWTTQPGETGSVYDDAATAWGVRARTQNSGKTTLSLMHRPETTTGGWGYLPDAASASLPELAASLATALDNKARELLDPDTVTTVEAVQPVHNRTAALTLRIQRLETEAAGLKKENSGLRKLAARAETDGRESKVTDYEQDEADNDVRLESIDQELVALRGQLDDASMEREADDEGNLNLFAYLVAVLERAGRGNGLGPEPAGRLCDRTFSSWRFAVDEQGLIWSCSAEFPLKGGDTATVPLSGRVRNLRNAAGSQRSQVVQDIFGEGRTVDDVAGHVGCGRKAVYDRYVMPWLRDHGVSATGAKCALVDHPFGLVRKIVWTLSQGGDMSRFPVTPTYLQTIRSVYFDPDTEWGGTAVPDDTTWVQRALDILSGTDVDPTAGMSVSELALIIGVTVEKVRSLARPRARKSGFVRPIYAEYTSPKKDRVRCLICPHDQDPATHVVLLPEVAASGFGVLCRHCRRVPTADPMWANAVFPEQYVASSWTRRSGKGSIMNEARTVAVA